MNNIEQKIKEILLTDEATYEQQDLIEESLITYLYENDFDTGEIKYQNLNNEDVSCFYFDSAYHADPYKKIALFNVGDFYFAYEEETSNFISEAEFKQIKDEKYTIPNEIEKFLEDYPEISEDDIEVKQTKEHGYYHKFEITSDKINGTYYHLYSASDDYETTKESIEKNLKAYEEEYDIENLEIKFKPKYKSGFESLVPVEISFDYEGENYDTSSALSISGIYQNHNQNYMEIFDTEIDYMISEEVSYIKE